MRTSIATPRFHAPPPAKAWHIPLACLLLVAWPSAHAQVAAGRAFTERAGYVELGVGTSDFSRVPSGAIGFDNDHGGTAYRISIGNYLFSPQWGLEGGYDDLGSVHRAGGTSSADAFHLHLIGRAPLGAAWNLLGKLGTTYGRTNVSSAAGAEITAGSEREFGWSYGVGLELTLAAPWSGVLQYDEHTLTFPGSGAERVSTTTLALRYHF